MKKRIIGILLSLALISALLAACGGGGDMGAVSNSAAPSGGAMADMAMPEAPMDAAEMDYGSVGESVPSMGQTESDALRDAKMIYTASLEMETTAFDEAVEGLGRLVREMDGYVENSSQRTGGSGYRWADYTVRVPAKNFQEFLSRAGELCHLTWRSESTENITEAYYDTAGRLKTQQIKLERLQELLSRAEAMEDIITIESAISETEYQIESLSGTLRHYDALVDYATVTVNLQEVYKLSSVEEAPDSFAARIGSAFTYGWAAFTSGMENLAVGLAYGWMWVVLLAAVLLLVFRVLRRRRRRFAPPDAEKTDDNPPKI